MRGYQTVAKSCYKIYIPQKYVCNYIYIYVSRSCALCPLLIHILLYHNCDILDTKHCVALSACYWSAGTFPDCRWSTNPSVLRIHPRLYLFVFLLELNPKNYTIPPPVGGEGILMYFFCFFGFFCFRTISLGHSELTEKRLTEGWVRSGASGPLKGRAYWYFLSFFFSWVSKTQPNHWTKRMANTQLAT